MECKCTKEKELATMETEIKTLFKITDKNKSDIKDLNKIYELIKDLTISVSVLAEQMKRNTDDISNIKSDVEEIKRKPSEDDHYNKRQAGKFEHYKTTIVVAILLAIVGFIMGKVL